MFRGVYPFGVFQCIAEKYVEGMSKDYPQGREGGGEGIFPEGGGKAGFGCGQKQKEKQIHVYMKGDEYIYQEEPR